MTTRQPVSAELQRSALVLAAWVDEQLRTDALHARDPATAIELGRRVGDVLVLAEDLRRRLKRGRR